MKEFNFRWFACGASGGEIVREDEINAKKQFYKTVFGAYRFEIRNRKTNELVSV